MDASRSSAQHHDEQRSLGRVIAKNALIVVPLNVALSLGYLYFNRFPSGPAHELPLWWIDVALPFLPWTVVPYLALLFSDLLLPLPLKDRSLFRVATRGYSFGMLLNYVVWALYPTTFPRPPAPMDESWTSALYRAICALDTPLTCLPSAHITIPAVGSWALARQYPRLAPLVWSGFALLSVTILTTKQHYFADLLAGLLTAALGAAASMAWERRAYAQRTGLVAAPAFASKDVPKS